MATAKTTDKIAEEPQIMPEAQFPDAPDSHNEEESPYIKVKARAKDHRVALWDIDPAHPEGEIFIVGDGRVYEVGLSAGVEDALDRRILVKVKG